MLAYPFSDHRDSVGSFPTHQGGIDLNVFEAVKQSVTTRQVAEHYGIHVGRNGMACCPFHHDKTPSMKLDRRYHCFGCGADGDVIDFTAALYGLGKKEPPYNWHRTSGFPMRTGSRRERQKNQSPGRNPRRNSFRKQRAAASVFLPTISICSGHGERTTPRTLRRKPFIPGLWKPYRNKTKWNICWMCCCSGRQRKKRL